MNIQQHQAEVRCAALMDPQFQSSPPLCANGCGFYGSAADNNLCSKCYAQYIKDHQPDAATSPPSAAVRLIRSPSSRSTVQEAAAAAAAPSSSTPVVDDQRPKPPRNRCGKCNKKMGLVAGFTCRCGSTFCGAHRYAEEHGCEFDFKNTGRAAIAENNPLVKADKLADRI